MVPEHLQGVSNGSSSVLSSPKQIRHELAACVSAFFREPNSESFFCAMSFYFLCNMALISSYCKVPCLLALIFDVKRTLLMLPREFKPITDSLDDWRELTREFSWLPDAMEQSSS